MYTQNDGLENVVCDGWYNFSLRFVTLKSTSSLEEYVRTLGWSSSLLFMWFGSCIVNLSTFWCSTFSVWFPKWYPDPTKEVGTGSRGRDQQAMRWFGKGDFNLNMGIQSYSGMSHIIWNTSNFGRISKCVRLDSHLRYVGHHRILGNV